MVSGSQNIIFIQGLSLERYLIDRSICRGPQEVTTGEPIGLFSVDPNKLSLGIDIIKNVVASGEHKKIINITSMMCIRA